MCSRARITSCCAAAALLVLIACGTEERTTLAASATSVDPICVNNTSSAKITVHGTMPVKPSVSLSGSSESTVEATYRLWVGDVELSDVAWVDGSTVTGVVPPGIAPGDQVIYVQSPFGELTGVAGVFRVAQGPCNPTGAALEITAEARPAQLAVGERVVVTATVKNSGDSTARGVSTAVTSPPGFTKFTEPADALDIQVGQTRTFTWTYTANAGAGHGTFSVTAAGIDLLTGSAISAPQALTNEVAVRYPVSVRAAGLTSAGLVLKLNGADDLAIPSNGTYSFATPVASGTTYLVSIFAQPAGHTCRLTGESGTVASGPVTSVVVNCDINSMSLSTALTGTGTGTLRCNGSACAATYQYGTTVNVTQTAATGSTFTGWSGDCAGTGTCSLQMTADRNVTATFTLQQMTLTTATAGNGTGTVECTGGPCQASYPYGTSVNLVATAGAGSTFTGWSGGCTGTNTTCALSMTANRTATATFSLLSYPVTITQTAGGTITGPATVVYGGTGTYTATPATGYSLSGWTCPGTVAANVCTVSNVTGPFTVSATYAVNTYPVTINQTAGGTVTGPATVNHGDPASFTASPLQGYSVNVWSGCTAARGATTCTVASATGPLTVSATFSLISYTVTITQTTGGTIAGPTSVAYGDPATFTANAATGYTFAAWTACPGTPTGNVCTVTNVTGPFTVSATYTPNTYQVTITQTTGGTVSGPATVNHGGNAVFSATASDGYTIGTWNGCTAAAGSTGCTVSNVTGDLTVSVTFVPIPYTVSGTITGLSGGDRVTLQLAAPGGVSEVTSQRDAFAFTTQLHVGATWQVTVVSQPPGFECTVTPASVQTMPAANVTDVSVACVPVP